MEFTEIIAECLGFIAIGIGFLIFQQKTRTGMLAMKLSADILWIIHFLLIGATSGMIVSIVVTLIDKEPSKEITDIYDNAISMVEE